MRAIVLLCLCVVSGLALGDSVRMTSPPGFVELSAPAAISPDASVSWEAKKPLGLDYREYLRIEGGRVCVLYLQPGEYVMSLDVIDWDARTRTKRDYVITVTGTPTPVPPKPVPPTPVPPNLTGLAKQIYELAVEIKLPAEYAKFAAGNFETVASMIAAGGIRDTRTANTKLLELNSTRKMPATAKKLGDAIDAYLEKYVRSDLEEARKAFDAIAKGLGAVK